MRLSVCVFWNFFDTVLHLNKKSLIVRAFAVLKLLHGATGTFIDLFANHGTNGEFRPID